MSGSLSLVAFNYRANTTVSKNHGLVFAMSVNDYYVFCYWGPCVWYERHQVLHIALAISNLIFCFNGSNCYYPSWLRSSICHRWEQMSTADGNMLALYLAFATVNTIALAGGGLVFGISENKY